MYVHVPKATLDTVPITCNMGLVRDGTDSQVLLFQTILIQKVTVTSIDNSDESTPDVVLFSRFEIHAHRTARSSL